MAHCTCIASQLIKSSLPETEQAHYFLDILLGCRKDDGRGYLLVDIGPSLISFSELCIGGIRQYLNPEDRVSLSEESCEIPGILRRESICGE